MSDNNEPDPGIELLERIVAFRLSVRLPDVDWILPRSTLRSLERKMSGATILATNL